LSAIERNKGRHFETETSFEIGRFSVPRLTVTVPVHSGTPTRIAGSATVRPRLRPANAGLCSVGKGSDRIGGAAQR
jgi:hypothetical protein